MTCYDLVHDADATVLHDTVVKDRKVSATDLGVYARFVFAAKLFTRPSLDTLVRELRMPREETESALMRLAALGYLDIFDK